MAKRKAQPAAGADPAGPALGAAREALARGDHRSSRRLAREALAAATSDAPRAEARRILADTRPDPAALIAAALVLLTIAFAAWAGLLRHR